MNSEDESYRGPPPIVYSRISNKVHLLSYRLKQSYMKRFLTRKWESVQQQRFWKLNFPQPKWLFPERKSKLRRARAKTPPNKYYRILSKRITKNSQNQRQPKNALQHRHKIPWCISCFFVLACPFIQWAYDRLRIVFRRIFKKPSEININFQFLNKKGLYELFYFLEVSNHSKLAFKVSSKKKQN